MSKKVAISLVFLLLVGGGLVYSSSSKNTSLNNNEATSKTVPSSTNDQAPTSPAANGKYVDYTDSTVSAASGQKVLFFHAPWCSQCRSIEQGIIKDGVPDGITIIKVDYDDNQKLRQKYGVTLQTTFVKIDGDNNLISKYVAYDEPTFDAVKRNFL